MPRHTPHQPLLVSRPPLVPSARHPATARRLALTTARRLALIAPRRLALTPARRLALAAARRLALTTARRLALTATRRLALIALLALVSLVPACLYEKLEDRECPPEGTELTFENFGKPFLDTHCNYCHGSAVLDRQSAPPAYVFETPQQVERWADRIYVRGAGPNTTMPPGPDDPPESEREKLAEWLACTYGD